MSTYLSERRTLLRGAALLALFVAGCQKKEEAASPTQSPDAAAPAPGQTGGPVSGAGSTPQGNSADGAPSGGGPASEATAPGGKLSQAQAKYQNQPKGDQKCANCMHFIAESNTCKVVEGKVSPDAWCMLWARKA
ncbi:MAG: high-potential iron-sulfur protein [Pseudomonadota bacterium]